MVRYPLRRAGGIGALWLGAGFAIVAAQKSPIRPQAKPSLGMTLATNKKQYANGEPIRLMLTVKNATKQPVTLDFPDGQHYEFEIWQGKPGAEKKVWQWSHGRMFAMMLTSTRVPAGKAVTFAETLDPKAKGPDGKPQTLGPGAYQARGYLAAAENRVAKTVRTATSDFTVR